MKINHSILFLFFVLFIGFAQQTQSFSVKLEGSLKGVDDDSKVTLYSYMKEDDIAEVSPTESDTFAMKIDDVQEGVYRLNFTFAKESKYINVILTSKEKEVFIEMNLESPSPSPTFANSNINKQWYEYKTKSAAQAFKIDLIHQFIEFYPDKGDSYMQDSKQVLFKKRAEYKELVNSYINQNKGIILAKVIKNNPAWFSANPTADKITKNKEKIEGYWKRVIDIEDEALVNTHVYTSLVNEYINLYFRTYELKEGIVQLKKAIDIVALKFSKNEKVKRHVYRFLLEKFKNRDVLSDVLQHLDENYMDATMVEGEELKKYAFRLASYKALKKQEIPPLIRFKNEKNQEVDFTKIEAKYFVLVFWESTCSHCREQMPEFDELLAGRKDVKALAVSMDTGKNSYERFIKKLPNMYHKCDFEGYKSNDVRSYFIESTPTFYLLDSNKKLINSYGDVKILAENLK